MQTSLQPHFFNVTSLTEGRLSIVERNGKLFVSKQTNEVEFKNLKRATKWLKRTGWFRGSNSGRNLTVTVPDVEAWDAKRKVLVMELCEGKNVETEMIGNAGYRSFYVGLLSDLLSWIRDNSFYWNNFAPRNVLFDRSTGRVHLVDFESPLRIGRGRMSTRRFTIYCQESIMLELAALLFKREQESICPNIWTNYRKGSIRIANIEGRRKRRFIRLNHPGKRLIKYAELVHIQRRIATIATPFRHKGSTFYPLHALSHITDVEVYVNTVLELESQKKNLWPAIIANRLTRSTLAK